MRGLRVAWGGRQLRLDHTEQTAKAASPSVAIKVHPKCRGVAAPQMVVHADVRGFLGALHMELQLSLHPGVRVRSQDCGLLT